MKKIFLFLLVSFLFSLVKISAADYAPPAVGLRFNYGRGFGSSLHEDSKNMDMTLEAEKSLDEGASFFFKIPVVTYEKRTNWNIQFELGFSSVNFKTNLPDDYDSYKSFGFAALCVYDFEINEKFTVSPLVGEYASIVFGNKHLSGACSGLTFGSSATYDTGHGAFVGDLRYNFGLGPLGWEDEKNASGSKMFFVYPRFFVFSIGYQIRLKA